MNKFFRSTLLTSMLAAGLAACGDDVTVVDPPPPPPPPAPAVHSITVGPDGGSVTVGATLTMVAAVNADAGVATTVTWSSSDNAKATVSAAGVVTGVAAGSVGIKACSTVNTSVCGVATVAVVAAPVATVTGVTITPPSATLVVGQSITASATVQGTNSPSQAVTWSSLAPAVATVDANGVVTAVANGTAVIKATSNANSSIAGTMSVTVFTPQPATISIQSITQGNLNTPVTLTNVNGQVEITLNVDNGAYTITKAQALVNGSTVIAEQVFASSSASAAPAAVPSTVVLSLNTRQVQKAGAVYVPVIFNGPNSITARIFVAGSANPISSNAIPVVMKNNDAIVAGTTPVLAPASTTPSFTTAGPTVWYKSNVNFTGGPNYISFFPVTPSITATSGACGASLNAVSGTPSTGITLAGQFPCLSSTFEGGVSITGWNVTAGTAPAADVVYLAAGATEQVGTAYSVAGSNRYNLLAGGSLNNGNSINIDTKPPVITPNAIGFLSGGAAPFNCETTGITPGCWIGASYNFAPDFPATDGGTGVASVTVHQLASSVPVGCAAATLTAASLADNTTANVYQACANAVDNIGNVAADVAGFNAFSKDGVAPTFTFSGTYAVAGVNPAEVNVNPAQTLDYTLTDNNSGIDANVGLSIATTLTVTAGACPAPVTTLTGAGTTPVSMLTPYDVSTCVPPGERTWVATARDRAGNAAATISRQLEFNPAAPVVNAVNIVPNYAAAAAINVDVLATDDEDLASGELTLSTTTNTGTDINVVFGPQGGFFKNIWGTDWDGSLFLNTTLNTNSRLSLAATYSLGAYVTNAAALGAQATEVVDTITTKVYDTFGAVSAAVVTPINAAFVTTSSYASGANPWAAAPGLAAVLTPAIGVVSGNCTFTYATPTNNPEVLSRVWVANKTGQVYTILADINAAPVLLSDNGIQRQYAHVLNSGACTTANEIIAIKGNVGAILF